MAKQPGPNVYLRGKTYWYRFVYKGTEYRGTTKATSQSLAERVAKKKRDEIVAHSLFGDERCLWREACNKWYAHMERHVAKSTLSRYLGSLVHFTEELDGQFVDQVDKKFLVRWIAKRQDDGVTNATIRRDLTALSSVLGFCDDQGWLSGNPALDRLRRLKERRDPIVLPRGENVRRIIERAPGNLAALIRAALHTGARLDELVQATRSQVDFARREMTVIGKGNKRRTFALSPEAYEAISSAIPALGCPYLFQHDGKPYASVSTRFRDLNIWEKKAADKAKPPREFRPMRFHDLRHVFAVNYLKGGGSIYTLKQILGHTSIATTELYIEFLTPEEAEQAKRKTG